MNEPLYTREILRLAASIPYLEPFEELEGATELRSPTCGSRMRMAVELDWADRVVRIRQAVEACAFGQATAAPYSLLCRHCFHAATTDRRMLWLLAHIRLPMPATLALLAIRLLHGHADRGIVCPAHDFHLRHVQ